MLPVISPVNMTSLCTLAPVIIIDGEEVEVHSLPDWAVVVAALPVSNSVNVHHDYNDFLTLKMHWDILHNGLELFIYQGDFLLTLYIHYSPSDIF